MATLYYKVGINANASWNTLANWYTNSAMTIQAASLPVSTDDIVINFTDGNNYTFFNANGTRTMASLTLNGPTGGLIYRYGTIGGGTYIVNGNVVVNNRTRIGSIGLTCNNIILNGSGEIASSSSPRTASVSVVFNDNSKITGTPLTTPLITFNDNSTHISNGNIATSAVFKGNSLNLYSIITGNATFSDNSGQFNGYIDGNLTITNTTVNYSTNPAPNYLSQSFFPIYIDNGIQKGATGTVTFNSVTPVSFIVGNSDESSLGWNLNSSSWIFSGGTPSWTFNNGSYMDSGTLSGNATFTGNSYFSSGTITGNVTFEDTSYNNGTLTFSGTVIYNGLTGENIYGYFVKGEKYTFIKIPVIVSNTTIFNNKSACGLVLDAGALSLLQGNGYTNIPYVAIPTITGNVSFKNSSINLGLITGNATFINRSENKSGISGTTTTTPDRGVNGSSILGVI